MFKPYLESCRCRQDMKILGQQCAPIAWI